ncbi:MAG TPA: hypothetical protein VGL99_12740 [Chloroflexota bacterium]
MERAIVQTVAYADVFDYPLTADELQRYLIGVSASRAAVRSALANGRLVPEQVRHNGRYFTLAGREAAIDIRRERAAISAELWRRAVRYGRLIGNLPFVRMVAVTGALAMDNVADGDIDYLIVTEPERLWLCRALVVGVVKLAARRGVTLCPNYFLSERALVLQERNLFTAHEVAQMVPLMGLPTYEQLRELNRWTESFLPNANGSPRRIAAVAPRGRRTRALAERALRTRVGGHLERWEMARKVRKLARQSTDHAEAAFDIDWCKGHFGDHGHSTLVRFAERMEALESRFL